MIRWAKRPRNPCGYDEKMIRFLPGLTMLPNHRLNLETLALDARIAGVPMRITWTFRSLGDRIEDHADRAAKLLSDEIQRDPNFRCHLFCHSMGGLVARFLVNHLKVSKPWGAVLKSITTFATPHRGTPMANSPAAQKIWTASWEMSDEGAVRWNDPDDPAFSPVPPGIPFYCWTTWLKSSWRADNLVGFLGYRELAKELKRQGRVTANDSVVPLDSQVFGTVAGDANVQHQFFSLPGAQQVRFYREYWRRLNLLHP